MPIVDPVWALWGNGHQHVLVKGYERRFGYVHHYFVDGIIVCIVEFWCEREKIDVGMVGALTLGRVPTRTEKDIFTDKDKFLALHCTSLVLSVVAEQVGPDEQTPGQTSWLPRSLGS